MDGKKKEQEPTTTATTTPVSEEKKEEKTANAQSPTTTPEKAKDVTSPADATNVATTTPNSSEEEKLKNLATQEKTQAAAGVVNDEESKKQLDALGKKVNNDAIHATALQVLQSTITQATSASANALGRTRDTFVVDQSQEASTFILTPSVTPFIVQTEEIPRLFELRAMKNGSQDPNLKDNVIKSNHELLQQIKDAGDMFNSDTMTVRIFCRPKINGKELGDPNDLLETSLNIKQVVSSIYDVRPLAGLMESRIIYSIKVFNAFDGVLFSIPTKEVVNQVAGPTEIQRELSNTSYWKGDYLHYYYAALNTPIPWLRTEISNQYRNAPIRIGETNTKSEYNKKVSATVRAITDQYAAAIANLTFFRLVNSQLTMNSFISRVKANMFAKDNVRPAQNYKESVLNLLYSPSDLEWNLMMMLIVVNKSVRDSIFNKYLPIISATNRLEVLPITSVWNPKNNASDPTSSGMQTTFFELISVGTSKSPYEMALLETLPHWFDISFNFPTLPSDYSAIIELYSLIIFFKCFPAIAQSTVNQLGWRMNALLKLLFPKEHIDFVTVYGEVRLNGKSARRDGTMITKDQSAAGYIYSIFDNLKWQRGVNTKYLEFIEKIRAACQFKSYPVYLHRKRAARYPYWRRDYQAFMSWPELEDADVQTDPITEWSTELTKLTTDFLSYTLDSKMLDSKTSGLAKATKAWLRVFYDTMLTLIPTASLPFQQTLYKYQDMMKNSFAYVHEQYDPQRGFHCPPSWVVAPVDSKVDNAGIPIQKSRILQLDPYIAMRYVISLQGELDRNISLATTAGANLTANLPTPQKDGKIVPGADLDQMAMGLVNTARRFGVAMAFVKWLTAPSDPDNPYPAIARTLIPILKMSNWVPLAKRIFAEFGFDFMQMYQDAEYPNSGIYDGRFLSRCIKEIDPVTNLPKLIAEPGTILGVEFEYIDDITRQIIRTISKPLLSPDSPILQVSRGFYLGRFLVEELTPTQPTVEQNWVKISAANVQYGYASAKNGSVHTITFTIDGRDEVYQLPYDVKFNNKAYMVIANTPTSIPISHKQVIAKAIQYGNLAYKFNNSRIAVTLIDKPMRTEDYSEDMSYSGIENILNTPDGGILEKTFITTEYASNFVSNAQTIPAYVQWICVVHAADRNLHASVINSGTQPTPQTKLPSNDELEYGMTGNNISLRFRDGTFKTESTTVNWNNEYSAIGKELYSMQIAIEYIPAQPLHVAQDEI